MNSKLSHLLALKKAKEEQARGKRESEHQAALAAKDREHKSHLELMDSAHHRTVGHLEAELDKLRAQLTTALTRWDLLSTTQPILKVRSSGFLMLVSKDPSVHISHHSYKFPPTAEAFSTQGCTFSICAVVLSLNCCVSPMLRICKVVRIFVEQPCWHASLCPLRFCSGIYSPSQMGSG